jgi:hypothetical protein
MKVLGLSCSLVAVMPASGWAQQKVPFRGDIPIAPSGIPRVPLPGEPVVYDTAEASAFALWSTRAGCRIPGGPRSCPTAPCS